MESWFFKLACTNIFRWDTHPYMSVFLLVRLSVTPPVRPSIRLSTHPTIGLFIRCAPYFRNRTSSDHKFWYTCVKWWYLLEFFSVLSLIFWVVRGVKGQKMAENDKNYVCCASYLRNYTYDCYLWYKCAESWYIQTFFSYFQSFNFLGC